MIPLSTWLSDAVGKTIQQTADEAATPAPTPAIGCGADFEMLLTERYESGVLHGRDAMRQEIATALADRAAQHDLEMVALRQQWTSTEARELTTLCRDLIAEVRSGIESDIASALSPFVSRRVLEQSVDAFRDVLAACVQSRAVAEISVSLPVEFRHDFEQLMGASGGIVSMTAASAMECSARSGDMSFETCVSDWLAVLEDSSGD